MGLSIEIFYPGAEAPLLYLRNHWEFHHFILAQQPSWLKPEWDDLIVTDTILLGVERALLTKIGELPIIRHLSFSDLQAVFDANDPTIPRQEDWLGHYLTAIAALRTAVARSKVLLYVWSA